MQTLEELKTHQKAEGTVLMDGSAGNTPHINSQLAFDKGAKQHSGVTKTAFSVTGSRREQNQRFNTEENVVIINETAIRNLILSEKEE